MARELAGYKEKSEGAAALGMEAETYRRWERAETEPSLRDLARVADVFGASLDMLIRGERSEQAQVAPFRGAEKKINRA